MIQDTSPSAVARYHELLRAQTPAQRLAQAAALTRATRELALRGDSPAASAGVRRRAARTTRGAPLWPSRRRADLRLRAGRRGLMAADTGDVDAVEVALRVAAAIEAVGGAYFLGGSLASSLKASHVPPTTSTSSSRRCHSGASQPCGARLSPDFEVDLDMLREALLHGGSCNIFYLPAVMKVDLFAVGPTPPTTKPSSAGAATQRSVRRARRSWSKRRRTPVLRKLALGWRKGGGHSPDRQWRDVVEILLRVSGPSMDQGICFRMGQ